MVAAKQREVKKVRMNEAKEQPSPHRRSLLPSRVGPPLTRITVKAKAGNSPLCKGVASKGGGAMRAVLLRFVSTTLFQSVLSDSIVC